MTSSHEVTPADPVDKWLDENPNFEDANPAPQAEPSNEPATETAPDDKPTEAEPKPAEAAPKPDAAPDAKPSEPAAQQPVAQPAPQAAPKPSYAADEKIGLADGVEWTRGQIVEALRERQSLLPAKAEAEGYKKLFLANSLEEAQKNWGPIMERLQREPQTTAFIDAFLADPEKAAYLHQCAAYFDEQNPNPQPRAAAAGVPVAQETDHERFVKQQLEELRSWKAAQEKRETDDRVQREWATCVAKYPWLAHDDALRRDLLMTAQYLHTQDQSKGLLDALAAKASILDALAIARNTAPAQPQVPVPALNGSPGASPSATRPARHKPRTNDPGYDAVEDWMQNPDPRFRS